MAAMMALSAGPSFQEAQHAFFGLGSAVFMFAAGTALIVSLLGILFMTLVVAPNLTQRFSSISASDHVVVMSPTQDVVANTTNVQEAGKAEGSSFFKTRWAPLTRTSWR